MYYYRIAILTLRSKYRLASFEAFACKKGDADITLEATGEAPQPGKDQVSGSIVHRAQPDGWYFHSTETDQTGLFVSSDYTRLRIKGAKGKIIFGKDEWFVRIALECWLARHGYVSLHAAAVEIGDRALAFTGPSGMGKSTRADMMIRSMEAKLINGDRPLIDVKGQRLYGVPWDGKEQCFRNVCHPLQAICEVRRSGSVYVREMSFQQRRKLLMRQCFMPMWDSETVTFQMANIMHMAASFPIVRVFCGPEANDVRALYDALQQKEYLTAEPEIRAKSGFVLKNTRNGYILMPADNSAEQSADAVRVNEVAALVWEKLQNPVSREDLLSAILDEFNVKKEVASADLDTLLETLRSYDMIDND